MAERLPPTRRGGSRNAYRAALGAALVGGAVSALVRDWAIAAGFLVAFMVLAVALYRQPRGPG